MEDTKGDYKDRRVLIRGLGLILLLIGATSAFFGPVEFYVFSLFSEGGRFYYPGFQFGSFMFANLTIQIIGYYVIAVVFISLGYGHFMLRRWARKLSVTAMWFWLILGLPLTVIFIFMVFSIKEYSFLVVLAILAFLAASYFVFPWLLLRFFKSHDARSTYANASPANPWLEKLPQPILVLSALFIVYALALHVPLFMRGITPVFGRFWVGLSGYFAIDLAFWILIGLIWGTLRQRDWAWWGGLVYIGTLTVSTLWTTLRVSYEEILALLAFPPTEMEILSGIPIQGYHLALFLGIPFIVTLVIIITSRRNFRPQEVQ
jgi:hypothetical protein